MEFDEMLDDGEPEAGTSWIARSRLVDAIEALEDAPEILLGNTRSFVRDRYGQAAALA
jgi:hypothetical protein